MHNKISRRWVLQVSIISLLTIAFIVLGFYFHVVLNKPTVYTHFGYIPIILAGLWWGRKSVLVAIVLGLVVFSFYIFGIGIGEFWNDFTRTIFYLIVALCVGILSEKIMAGQRALSISEEKHRNLTENALAGIFVYRDNKVLFVNPMICKILDHSENNLIGKIIWDFIYQEDLPMVKDGLLERKQKGFTTLNYECRLVRKDSKIIWADITSSVINYEGHSAVLVNVYDITLKKDAEREREELIKLASRQEKQLIHSTRLAELGEMSAAIAHEVNQPLTGIKNFAKNTLYMIEKEAGRPVEIKENLQMISDQVDRAKSIISHMRKLTKRSETQSEKVNINQVLKDSVEFLLPQLKLSQVKVNTHYDDNVPETIGNKIQIEQIFINILTNARQSMEEVEKRVLFIHTSYHPDEDFPITVEITDTGRGFPNEKTKEMFEPFYSTKKSGTGLGLSISMSIIKEHNGNIEAHSMPGKGAKFIVKLPVNDEKIIPWRYS